MLASGPAERHPVGVDRAPGNQLPVLVLDHDVGTGLQLLELPLDCGGGRMGHHVPDEARWLYVTPFPVQPLSQPAPLEVG
jgi:hypothetical protein